MIRENDYIAEYIKEKYPRLLGLDFAMWKIPKVLSNSIKHMANAFKRINDDKEYMEEAGVSESLKWHEIGKSGVDGIQAGMKEGGRMTKEEAISELRLGHVFCSDKHEEAVNMAIRSLEAWDKVIEEIEKHRRKTKGIDEYDLVGDCLDLIKNYMKEVEE